MSIKSEHEHAPLTMVGDYEGAVPSFDDDDEEYGQVQSKTERHYGEGQMDKDESPLPEPCNVMMTPSPLQGKKKASQDHGLTPENFSASPMANDFNAKPKEEGVLLKSL